MAAMRERMAALFDPMVAMLALACALAVVAPARGEGLAIARAVSTTAIFLLFLINGLRVPRGEILRSFVQWRFFLPLFAWVFGVMPMIGWGLSALAADRLAALVALGFVYLGCLPSTVQSATSYTSIAGGNIALSVVGAALLNIAGVFLTAPLFALLGGGQAADIGGEAVLRIVLVLVLPFVIGQMVQRRLASAVARHRAKLVWVDRVVISIAVYVAFSGAVDRGLLTMFSAADWLGLIGLVLAFLALANLGAWALGGLLGQKREDRIAFLFAASQKSVAVGAPLSTILFAPEAAGFVIAPLLLYHLVQLVFAAPLANMLRRAAV